MSSSKMKMEKKVRADCFCRSFNKSCEFSICGNYFV